MKKVILKVLFIVSALCLTTACPTQTVKLICDDGFIIHEGECVLQNPDGSACIAQDADAFDDKFLDSNCDGVDGDASKSVFVDINAASDGDGSLENPVVSITKGLEISKSENKPYLLIAKGEYNEAIVLHDGVELHGGYVARTDSYGWSRSDDNMVKLKSAGPVVSGTNLMHALLNRVDVEAEDAMGGSSIGMLFIDSDIRIEYGLVKAGNGVNGTDGIEPKILSEPTVATRGLPNMENVYDANTPLNREGGKGSVAMCLGGSESRGGNGCSVVDGNLVNANAGDSHTDQSTGGLGGTNGDLGIKTGTQDIVSGTVGEDGLPGQNGESGRPGLNVGVFLSGAYRLSDGTAGQAGISGSSGGGGGCGLVGFNANDMTLESFCREKSYQVISTGGGGGHGGCGGPGGFSGDGGGASISILIKGNSLVLKNVILVSKNGGDAGKGTIGLAGHDGTAGSPGGEQFFGAEFVEGCLLVGAPGYKGGGGGKGGNGGHGGGGGGGPSIGVFIVGDVDYTPTEVSYTIGEAGKGGTAARVSLNGEDGLAKEVYRQPAM